jgi:hypothetical protein
MSFTSEQLQTQWAELSSYCGQAEIKVYSGSSSWNTIPVGCTKYPVLSARWMGNFIQAVFENGEVRNYWGMGSGEYTIAKNGNY